MNATHTPGPWRERAVVLNGEVHGYSISKAGGVPRRIADVLPIDEGAIEGGANAALLAAAPDLLAALERLHDDTADYIRINNLGDPYQNQNMRDARAAIAKAIGEQV